MDYIVHDIVSLNPYFIYPCLIYSFIGGILLPEIGLMIYPKRGEPIGFYGLKFILFVPFCGAVACFPGAILAWTVDQNYGRLTLGVWLSGVVLRRALDLIGIGRDPIEQRRR